MLEYVVRRILFVVPLLLIVVTIVFFAMRLTPGGPASALLGEYASASAIEKLEHKLGLDRPLWKQYQHFLGKLLHGDLGVSIYNGKPVLEQLVLAFPYTASLCMGALLFGLLLGIPIGIVTAARRNSLEDYIGRVLSLGAISIPDFYLAILMIIVFSIKLNFFPMIGSGNLSNIWDFLHSLILPAFTLGIIMSAFVSRSMRSSLLEVLSADYVTTARAKGLPEILVLLKHALRTALVPTIAFVGIYVTLLLGGTVVIEVVFSRTGWGRILVNAMKQRDYPILQAGLMVFSAIVVFVNLAVDLLYAYVDPRIRYT